MLKRILTIAALLLPGAAAAQQFPTRPVTMVVPFAAGGPIDVLGRLLQGPMGEALGQPVIVENKPGTTAAAPA
jgi:tripartite-type tricarboxylate transporter receptor subunit TctC